MLHFHRLGLEAADRIAIEIETLIIAGWAGRDEAAIHHHIEELAAIGVSRPSATPLFYRAAASNLTQSPTLSVLGPDTSGEVEPVLVSFADGLWLGVGSDHTDRKAETVGVALSKQLCGKPISETLWRLSDVEAHWDDLMLRAWATIGGARALYQEGPLKSLRTPGDLLSRLPSQKLEPGGVMFCGTLGAIGGVRAATRFEMELVDQRLGRAISASYDVRALPVVS